MPTSAGVIFQIRFIFRNSFSFSQARLSFSQAPAAGSWGVSAEFH